MITTDPLHGTMKLEPSDEVLKELYRLRAENEKLRAALKPITDIKAFTCIYEWTPVEALRDDEKVHVKLTGAQIKAMRAAAALKETGELCAKEALGGEEQ